MQSYSYGSALNVNTQGMTSVGQGAATTGTYNTCIGFCAGLTNALGANNTLIGYQSQGSGGTGATAIGASASVSCTGTTASLALGYGASTVGDRYCAIGAQTDAVTVVEYGTHFCYHRLMLLYSGNLYGGQALTMSAAEVLDGLIAVYSLTASTTYTICPAAEVIAAIPDCRIGTAWYLKIGLYSSATTAIKLNVVFGTGWVLRGKTGTQVIPTLARRNGTKNFLCTVTQVTPTPSITVICPHGFTS